MLAMCAVGELSMNRKGSGRPACRWCFRTHSGAWPRVDPATGVKGLEKVRTEWSLITLAYNLKCVLNLVSFEKLIAAVA